MGRVDAQAPLEGVARHRQVPQLRRLSETMCSKCAAETSMQAGRIGGSSGSAALAQWVSLRMMSGYSPGRYQLYRVGRGGDAVILRRSNQPVRHFMHGKRATPAAVINQTGELHGPYH